jgi:glycosyltransferase involved in cell wall biosynthesis
MRVLVDYRPALRQRSGVGEYMHNLVRAYARHPAAVGDEISVFTSSWKDRPHADVSSEIGAHVVDRRVPVRILNYAWHRLEWPPIEALGMAADVVHAAHPLLIPTRQAAQVVTIHDLSFLTSPESTRAEIRRDYAALARAHAWRADAVVTNSHYTAALVARTFDLPVSRLHVCLPGRPVWRALGRAPNIPREGYVLFLGTLEARKNVGALLDAYERLVARHDRIPPLVLAGRPTADAAPWLERLSRPPLAGHVRHVGYVPATDLENLYAGARLLVVPSREEGFGIPALEAMSAGVPVVAAHRGALPEVIGDAGPLVNPDDPEALASAMHLMLTNEPMALACARRGLARAQTFSWDRTAVALRGAYEAAVAARRNRRVRLKPDTTYSRRGYVRS